MLIYWRKRPMIRQTDGQMKPRIQRPVRRRVAKYPHICRKLVFGQRSPGYQRRCQALRHSMAWIKTGHNDRRAGKYYAVWASTPLLRTYLQNAGIQAAYMPLFYLPDEKAAVSGYSKADAEYNGAASEMLQKAILQKNTAEAECFCHRWQSAFY